MPIEIIDDRDDVKAAENVTGLLFGLPHPPADHPQLPAGISLCMIVKDEEAFLDGCLRSVADAVDEINVYDTGSTDRTVEIARAYGANVALGEWRSDFGWARNQSLAMATRRWILVLDADEQLTPDSLAFLRNLREVPAYLDVVYLRIVNAVSDEAGDAEVSHALPRIFPNTPRIRYRGLIHENIALDGGAIELGSVTSPLRAMHLGYTASLVEARKKADRNYPLIRKDVEERPDDSFAWFNLAGIAIASARWDEAIEAYDRVFALETRDRSFLPLAWVNLATAWYNKEKKADRALEVLDECERRIPTYASAFFTRGDILMRVGRYAEARAAFRRADELRGTVQTHFVVDDTISEWRADAYIAETYVREGEHLAALEHLRAALVRKPDARILRIRAAAAAEAAGLHAEADAHLRHLAAGGNPEDALRYAEFLVRRNDHARAQTVLDGALAHVGGGAVAEAIALGASTVALALGRYDDVERFLREVVARHPAHGPAVGALEQTYDARGDAEALRALRAAELAAEPRTPADWLRRSHRLLADGDAPSAALAAERGLALDGDDERLRYNAGLAALRAGDVAAGLGHLDAIVFGAGEVARAAIALRVRVLLDRGDVAGAANLLGAFSAAVPAVHEAVVERARLLDALGRSDDAEAVLRERAGHPSIAVEYATRLMRAGRLDEARRIAEGALRVS